MPEKLTDTLVLMNGTNPDWLTFDRYNRWDVPSGPALRSLYDMLGEGSQAFVFHEGLFGCPCSGNHDAEWDRVFLAELQRGFGSSNIPGYYLTIPGTSRRKLLHNSASSYDCKLHGRETCEYDRLSKSVPVKLIARDNWEAGLNPAWGDMVFEHAILRALGGENPLFQHNRLVSYSSVPTPGWFNTPDGVANLGLTSTIYQRLAVVRSLETLLSMPDFVVDLQPAAAAGNR